MLTPRNASQEKDFSQATTYIETEVRGLSEPLVMFSPGHGWCFAHRGIHALSLSLTRVKNIFKTVFPVEKTERGIRLRIENGWFHYPSYEVELDGLMTKATEDHHLRFLDLWFADDQQLLRDDFVEMLRDGSHAVYVSDLFAKDTSVKKVETEWCMESLMLMMAETS